MILNVISTIGSKFTCFKMYFYNQ